METRISMYRERICDGDGGAERKTKVGVVG